MTDTITLVEALRQGHHILGPSERELLAADVIERLTDALKRVLADIAEYERANNLAPNPGRLYCWDSVAHAHATLNIHNQGQE